MTRDALTLALLLTVGCDGPLEFGGMISPCDEDALAEALEAAASTPTAERADFLADAMEQSCPLDPALQAWVRRWASADLAPPPASLRAAWPALCPTAPDCDPLAVWEAMPPEHLEGATSPEDALLAAVIGKGLSRRGVRPSVTGGLPAVIAGTHDAIPVSRSVLGELGPDAGTLPTATVATAPPSTCPPWRADGQAPPACTDPLWVAAAPDAGALEVIAHPAHAPQRHLLTRPPDDADHPWSRLGSIPFTAEPGGSATGPTLRLDAERAVLWLDGSPRFPAHEVGDPSLAQALQAIEAEQPLLVALDPETPVQDLVDVAVATGGRALRVAPAATVAWPHVPPIPSNDRWNTLEPHDDPRRVVAAAGEALGTWGVSFVGQEMDGSFFTALAAERPDEPFLRVVRESIGHAVDLDDFLLFLDDVVAAGKLGRRGERLWVSAGRARSAGVLIHPDDVFKDRPRNYGRRAMLHVDVPAPQSTQEPAADGDPPGPRWTARYRNPSSREALLEALDETHRNATWPTRIRSLIRQLEAQGAQVWVTSTLRSPHRGYLMWGAFVLSKQKTDAQVTATIAMLEDRNRAWGLDTPITWRHPGGTTQTIESARAMKEAYDVVYATEGGARSSNHYTGVAVDLVAIGLPAKLTLEAPDGAKRTFDLSDPAQTRDLSLTPQLIEWIEEHFQARKLKSDYPHWNDTAPPLRAKEDR